MTLRWRDAVFTAHDEVADAIAAAAKGRTIFILGEGFDPRALQGLRFSLETGVVRDLTVVSLGLGPGGEGSPRASLAAANRDELVSLVRDAGAEHVSIPFPERLERRRSLGRLHFQRLLEAGAVSDAAHVIIDVSALPTSVYFAIIAGVLDLTDAGRFHGNLQVVVSENPLLDMLIHGEGTETPETIARFAFEIDLESRGRRPLVVWAPVMGGRGEAQLDALQRKLRPDEICPVLPFPATNPRRSDDLLIEYRELLADALRIEPANYMYADESNPLDLYRGLSRLHERYRAALAPVGDVTLVVSIHSSKTLSLGALMAAYEHRLPVMNADPEHYVYSEGDASSNVLAATRLACLWLEGLPFDGRDRS